MKHANKEDISQPSATLTRMDCITKIKVTRYDGLPTVSQTYLLRVFKQAVY